MPGAQRDENAATFAVRRAAVAVRQGEFDRAEALVAPLLEADQDDAENATQFDSVVDRARFILREVQTARLAALCDLGEWTAVLDSGWPLIESSNGEAGDAIHQMINDALVASGGFDAAFSWHRLEVSSRPAGSVPSGSVVACMAVRDGMWHLSRYLDRLRAQDVDRFFVIDNGSVDGTADFLADQPDVHLWATDANFSMGNSGAAWFDVILRKYAVGAWTLILDLDEEICFAEHTSVPAFCRQLSEHDLKAATGYCVDVYRRPGDPESLFVDRNIVSPGGELKDFPNQPVLVSKFRERAFGRATVINKAPLQLYEPGLRLCLGQHFTYHDPKYIAARASAIIHHKFCNGYETRVQGIVRDEAKHASWRTSSARILARVEEHGENVYDPVYSVEFSGPEQLVANDTLVPIGTEPRL